MTHLEIGKLLGQLAWSALKIYGLVLLAMYFVQDYLLFHPQPLPAGHQELSQLPGVRPLELVMADGITLRGWWVAGRHAVGPAAVYFGGNAEEVSWMVREAQIRPDVHWLIINYRGWGASAGKPSQQALCSDALSLYDWLRKQPEVSTITAVGRSLGSGVATHLAAHRPLDGVVLVTPFDSVRAVAARQYPMLPVAWLLRHPFDSMQLAPTIPAPMLMLPALNDEMIAPAQSRVLFDAWAGPKQWHPLDGVGHNDVDVHADYWASIYRFILATHRSHP